MSPIANMLTQLKNAQAAGLESIAAPFSSIKFEIAKILKNKGFISEVEKKNKKGKKSEHEYLDIKLNGRITGIKLISKPSRRMYAGKTSLKPVKSGFGISIISTPKGIMTGEDARKNNVGGEVIFEIW